jgi:hypothetical protein
LNADRLFPGAKIRTVGHVGDNNTLITTILELLNKTEGRVLTAKELSKLIDKDWRKVSRDVLTPDFLRTITALGWRYVPVKGRVGRGKEGTRFERIAPEQSSDRVGALSSNLCAEQVQVGNSGTTQVSVQSPGVLSAYM